MIYDATFLIAFLAGCFVGSVTGGVALFFGAVAWYYNYEKRVRPGDSRQGR